MVRVTGFGCIGMRTGRFLGRGGFAALTFSSPSKVEKSDVLYEKDRVRLDVS